MAFGFGKDRRLRRRVDFVHVQTHGERATSRHFIFLVTARESANAPARLGIVTTRKVGNAVIRNRIKRVCRECFRLWPGFVPDGTDLVVIAREGAHELPLAEVRSEWSRARPALLKRCESVLRRGPVTPSRETKSKRSPADTTALVTPPASPKASPSSPREKKLPRT